MDAGHETKLNPPVLWNTGKHFTRKCVWRESRREKKDKLFMCSESLKELDLFCKDWRKGAIKHFNSKSMLKKRESKLLLISTLRLDSSFLTCSKQTF